MAILAGGICPAQTPPQVEVEGGLLQRTSENGLSVYRGIPFAAPPVGDLRWRPPQPTAKWQDIKPVDKFGPRCYQGARYFLIGGGGCAEVVGRRERSP